jgi:hypothetical protein
MSLKVIDISDYQSDQTAAMSDADGVIIKATQGTGFVAGSCDRKYQIAKKAGKLLGVYHYAAGGDAVAEANYFYNNAKNYFHEAIPILDWEKGQNAAWGSAQWCYTFAKRIHDLTGVWIMLYTGSDGVKANAALVPYSALWFAGYPDLRSSWSAPNFPYSIAPFKALTGWQFTDSNGQLDRSIFYIDAKAWKAIANPYGASKPTVPSKPATKPKVTAVTVKYALRGLNGAWLGDVTNFNNSNDNGYAGNPNHQHDYLTVSVSHGSVKYRVKTAQDGWLGWVTKSNKKDLVNGAAGVAGHAITGVQIVYNTPSGETYQQAYYRSQTTKRAGWLAVCADDGSIKGFDSWAGEDGEPLDRLQVKIAPSNPF